MTPRTRCPGPTIVCAALLLAALAARADTPASAIVVVAPDRLEWAALPQLAPEIRVARLVGNPATAGPYALRVRLPAGSAIPPHTHPDARLVTVISGIYGFGVGERVDPAHTAWLPVGTAILVPAGTAHYSAAGGGEVVVQESGVGPSGTVFIEAAGGAARQP